MPNFYLKDFLETVELMIMSRILRAHVRV
jgi:hypothetical protein